MKIFTVTFHHSHNYGALLQAYALQQTILKMGNENSIFEYPYRKEYYSKVNYSTPKTFFRSIGGNILKFVRKKKLLVLDAEFKRFHNTRLNLSHCYKNMKELRDNPPKAECYISGSDQVWNLSTSNEFIPARFLDFGEDSIKRISYAASVEKLNYSEKQKELVREYLKKFTGISLREETAKDYIKIVSGKECIRVLDPVFLLTQDEWREIARFPRVSEPYILCYQVQSNSEMKRVAKELQKITGYKIVSICNSQIKYFNADYSFFDVSPEEFLGFYINAKIVISASFHGTAFGILFHKPTYGLLKDGGTSRIKEILELFELSDYCVSKGSNINYPKYEFERQQEILADERKKSIIYLEEQLANEN